MRLRSVPSTLVALGLFAVAGLPAAAGSHTWDVNELFSNASGTIQFIELRETNGTPGETAVGGHNVTSNTHTFTIASSVAAPTTFRHLLFATAGFAALPGAPTPDQIIPAGMVPFFSVNGDTVSYVPWDALTFFVGQLPTDGVNSMNFNFSTGPNSPTNYAGQTGSVNANTSPPGVPDGAAGSTPMAVQKVNAAGSRLSVFWDTTTCTGAANHQIIYGQGSQLPSVPGGLFSLSGSACGIGTASPFAWNTAPSASDGTGLIWWLIVAHDGAGTEGSWGKGSNGAERNGPGPNGSSGQCGILDKNLGNVCGN